MNDDLKLKCMDVIKQFMTTVGYPIDYTNGFFSDPDNHDNGSLLFFSTILLMVTGHMIGSSVETDPVFHAKIMEMWRSSHSQVREMIKSHNVSVLQ